MDIIITERCKELLSKRSYYYYDNDNYALSEHIENLLTQKNTHKRNSELENCSVVIMTLPVMSDYEYNMIKPIVEYAGGHWKAKEAGFQFKGVQKSVDKKIRNILSRSKITLSDAAVFQMENQYYPTPENIAKDMIEEAKIKPTDTVLEPSAGRGSLLKQITLKTSSYEAVEKNRTNANFLRAQGYKVHEGSFEEYYQEAVKSGKKFDKVVMNPPFCDGIEYVHIAMAYNLLKSGGRLIALIPENSTYYGTERGTKFSEFFINKHEEGYAESRELPINSFERSGTNIDIMMIIIDKEDNEQLDIT